MVQQTPEPMGGALWDYLIAHKVELVYREQEVVVNGADRCLCLCRR